MIKKKSDKDKDDQPEKFHSDEKMTKFFNLQFKTEKNLNDIRFCNLKERKDYVNLKESIEKDQLNKKNLANLMTHILTHRERFDKAFTSST